MTSSGTYKKSLPLLMTVHSPTLTNAKTASCSWWRQPENTPHTGVKDALAGELWPRKFPGDDTARRSQQHNTGNYFRMLSLLPTRKRLTSGGNTDSISAEDSTPTGLWVTCDNMVIEGNRQPTWPSRKVKVLTSSLELKCSVYSWVNQCGVEDA